MPHEYHHEEQEGNASCSSWQKQTAGSTPALFLGNRIKRIVYIKRILILFISSHDGNSIDVGKWESAQNQK